MIGAFPNPLSVSSTILSGGIALSAGTNIGTSGTVVFADSNGVTFGMDGAGIVTASVSAGGAGALSISAGTVNGTRDYLVFSNSNNVSFGMNGSTITATASGGGGGGAISFSAGTLSGTRDSIVFSNSNGVSFGMNGSTITATVATNYLTTAALSADSSKYAGVGESTGTVAGTTLGLTVNTDGVSVLYPNWLTTAALSGDTTKYAGVGESTGTIAGSTLGLTVNTDGVSIAYPKWLTTAGLSGDTTKYAGVGETVGTVAGTDIGLTVNTDGVSIAYPKAITTAALSGDTTKYVQEWAFTGNTAGTTSSAQGTRLYLSGGNSITLSGNSNTIVFSVGNYITTARGSTDAVGLNTAQTNVTWTVNSSGLSINAGGYAGTGKTLATTAGTDLVATLNTAGLSMGYPKWITTAALSGDTTKYAGVGETVGTTSGTDIGLTVNTDGVSIAYPKAITTAMLSNAVTLSNIKVSAGTLSALRSDITFANGGGLSFGLETNGVITGTIGTSAGVLNFSAGTSSANINSLVFADSNNVSWGLNGSTVTGSVPASSLLTAVWPVYVSQNASTISFGLTNDVKYWDNVGGGGAATAQLSSLGTLHNTVMVFPLGMMAGSITANTFMIDQSSSGTGNSSSAPKVGTTRFGLYTLNGSTLSMINSFSTANSITANAGNSTQWSGQRWMTVATTDWSSRPVLSQGVMYWGALFISTGGNNSNPQTGGFIGMFPHSTAARSGMLGVAVTAATHLGFVPFLGVFTGSGALPASIDKSNVNAQSASGNFIPHIAINNLSSYL